MAPDVDPEEALGCACEPEEDEDDEASEVEPATPVIRWKPGERWVDAGGKAVPEALLRGLLRLNLPLGRQEIEGSLVPKAFWPRTSWFLSDHGYPSLDLFVTERGVEIVGCGGVDEGRWCSGGAMGSCMSSRDLCLVIENVLKHHQHQEEAASALFPDLV